MIRIRATQPPLPSIPLKENSIASADSDVRESSKGMMAILWHADCAADAWRRERKSGVEVEERGTWDYERERACGGGGGRGSGLLGC